MKGKGLSKTIFKGMDLVSVVNYDINKEIRLEEAYGFFKSGEIIEGTGVLVCYSGDLNDIIEIYKEEPIWTTITDKTLRRVVLSNGIAIIKLTDIVTYDWVIHQNYVNAFNSGLDLICIRKEFDKLAPKELFKDTLLPQEVYYSLKTLFHGGVMNAEEGYYYNVKSADLVSAHASNIVNETYPLGIFEKTYMSLDALKNLRKQKDIFYIGNVTFKNIRLKPGYIGIIFDISDLSQMPSKMVEYNDSNYLISAEEIRLPITEIYMECIDMCYEYDAVVDQNLYLCIESGKLPDNLREHVLSKFNDKQTKSKDTKEYKEAKLLVNLCYGFLCRGTEDYKHYAVGHKLVWPFQFGVYTCLYTTYKIVKAMHEVIQRGGQVIAIATDSIKYIGDFDLEWGNDLGQLKYEGTYDRAYMMTVYRAVLCKDNEIEVKLAGCIKEKAEEYFKYNPAEDIFSNALEIPQGKVTYEYNYETYRIEPRFFSYTTNAKYTEEYDEYLVNLVSENIIKPFN